VAESEKDRALITAEKPPEGGPEPASKGEVPPYDQEMTLMEHMIELRDRLVKAVLGLAVGSLIGFVFARRVFELLVLPLGPKADIQALSPTDSIIMYFKVSLVLGMVIGMPVILYQVVQFVLPGLYPEERRYLFFLLPSATVAFATGAVFAALVVVPFSVRYLSGFMADIITPEYAVKPYVGFVTSLMFWIGVVFEMPLVVFFLSKLGVIDYQRLAGARKYAIVIIAILAAVITPTPDPVTMMLVMGPLIILYEVGVQLSRLA